LTTQTSAVALDLLENGIGAIRKCRPPQSTAAYGSKSDSGKASNSAFINYPTDGKNAIGYAAGTSIAILDRPDETAMYNILVMKIRDCANDTPH